MGSGSACPQCFLFSRCLCGLSQGFLAKIGVVDRVLAKEGGVESDLL